jgi:hypothetical protein
MSVDPVDLIQISVDSLLKYLSVGTGRVPNKVICILLDLILWNSAVFTFNFKSRVLGTLQIWIQISWKADQNNFHASLVWVHLDL